MLAPFRAASIYGMETLTLTSTPTGLPNLPSADSVNQLTIRTTDHPWEWRFDSISGSSYFWMAAGDIMVIPIRDQAQLQDFTFKAVSTAADTRILYE